jgi:tRNA (guanine37-N1)-methyltransferase
MRFDIITIFPEFFTGPLDYGIVRRARDAGLIKTCVHDLRQFTHDRHRTVDDRPFGGGEGMVMKPEPLFEAVESLLGTADARGPVMQAPAESSIVLLSAAGRLFRQETARRFRALDRIILLCGRYEGVDERVAEHLATEEISIGDFVLSGGELAAALIVDAVTRLVPGALGNEDSAVNESFSQAGDAGPTGQRSRTSAVLPNRGILDFPHYTRPQSFRGWDVPAVLAGGNHEEIARWRRAKALEKTERNRPDLLPGAPES